MRRIPLQLLLMTAFVTACSKGPSYQFESLPKTLRQLVHAQSLWDPQLEVSTSGTIYMLAMFEAERKPRLGFVMSHDGGDTFMHMIPVSPSGAEVTSHGESAPRLANSGTVLYALWRQPEADGGSRLLLGRSLSYGHSFENPVEVTHQKSFVSFATVAALPNGEALAAWLDGRDEEGGSETFSVYSARSTGQGAGFKDNVRVGSTACPCCRPSIAAAPGGKIFIVWRKVFPNDFRDMVVATSDDGAATFGEPVRISKDGWSINGCPDSGPSAVFVNGRLFVAWMTEGQDSKPRIRFAWSGDEGRSFARPRDISGPILDPNHPVLKATTDGKLVAIFQGRDPNPKDSNWTRTQAFAVEVDHDGTASLPTPLSSASQTASYPTIAAGTGRKLFAAWTQPDGETETVLLARGRRKP